MRHAARAGARPIGPNAIGAVTAALRWRPVRFGFGRRLRSRTIDATARASGVRMRMNACECARDRTARVARSRIRRCCDADRSTASNVERECRNAYDGRACAAPATDCPANVACGRFGPVILPFVTPRATRRSLWRHAASCGETSGTPISWMPDPVTVSARRIEAVLRDMAGELHDRRVRRPASRTTSEFRNRRAPRPPSPTTADFRGQHPSAFSRGNC